MLKMTFLELRRNPSKLLDSLERGEEVILSRRNQTVGRFIPEKKAKARMKIADHPAFGMWADRDDMKDPTEWVRNLRKGRFRDL